MDLEADQAIRDEEMRAAAEAERQGRENTLNDAIAARGLAEATKMGAEATLGTLSDMLAAMTRDDDVPAYEAKEAEVQAQQTIFDAAELAFTTATTTEAGL